MWVRTMAKAMLCTLFGTTNTSKGSRSKKQDAARMEDLHRKEQHTAQAVQMDRHIGWNR
jgi:hypothetical protein